MPRFCTFLSSPSLRVNSQTSPSRAPCRAPHAHSPWGHFVFCVSVCLSFFAIVDTEPADPTSNAASWKTGRDPPQPFTAPGSAGSLPEGTGPCVSSPLPYPHLLSGLPGTRLCVHSIHVRVSDGSACGCLSERLAPCWGRPRVCSLLCSFSWGTCHETIIYCTRFVYLEKRWKLLVALSSSGWVSVGCHCHLQVPRGHTRHSVAPLVLVPIPSPPDPRGRPPTPTPRTLGQTPFRVSCCL